MAIDQPSIREVDAIDTATGTDEDPGLFAELGQVADDGRTYLEAEIAYQRERATFALGRAKSIIVFGALGIVLAILALVALVAGVLIGLTGLIGPWAATAIVVIGLLVLAWVCVKVASIRVSRLTDGLGTKAP